MFSISSELWAIISIGFALCSLVPYLITTLIGNTRPHIFTWVIWSFITIIAFFVQHSSGAGPGAWPTGVTAFFCLIITLAAFKKGEKEITPSDWITFLAALAAIPIWMATQSTTLAAIWITVIDLLAYYPTYRKSWLRPHQEMASSRILGAIKHVFSLMAMDVYVIATVLYPLSLVIMNSALFAMIIWRRHALKSK